eukprot:5604512-Pleurochrysis_carterae.AAC.1
MGAEGEAEVAAGAYRLRATLGAPPGAAAKGALVARALAAADERAKAQGGAPRHPGTGTTAAGTPP